MYIQGICIYIYIYIYIFPKLCMLEGLQWCFCDRFECVGLACPGFNLYGPPVTLITFSVLYRRGTWWGSTGVSSVKRIAFTHFSAAITTTRVVIKVFTTLWCKHNKTYQLIQNIESVLSIFDSCKSNWSRWTWSMYICYIQTNLAMLKLLKLFCLRSWCLIYLMYTRFIRVVQYTMNSFTFKWTFSNYWMYM